MWQREQGKERNRWFAFSLSQCLCCNTVCLVKGWALLIEFLPSDTGPIATCISAATGCRKPNTGAQVVQQSGGVACYDSHTVAPICHLKSCFPVVKVLQDRASLSLTNQSRDWIIFTHLSCFFFRLYFVSFIKLQVRFLCSGLKRKQDSKPHPAEDEEVIINRKKTPWMWSCCLCLCFVILSGG